MRYFPLIPVIDDGRLHNPNLRENFIEQVQSDDKRELLEVIEQYHKGYIPLIVPIVLINHYVRKLDEPYLKTQFYLNPHPIELMLRNHV